MPFKSNVKHLMTEHEMHFALVKVNLMQKLKVYLHAGFEGGGGSNILI